LSEEIGRPFCGRPFQTGEKPWKPKPSKTITALPASGSDCMNEEA